MDWPTAAIIITVITGSVGIIWRIFFNGSKDKNTSVIDVKIETINKNIEEMKGDHKILFEKIDKTNERIDKLATLIFRPGE